VRVARLETTGGSVVCGRCSIADRPWTRLRGLLGRAPLAPDEGLLMPAGAVHMFFMRFAVDAVFCDRELAVLRVVPGLQPWRLASQRGAKVVVELAEGAAAGLRPGDRLRLATIEA